MEVTTYTKLETFIDRWIAGTIDLLIIESKAGMGKSHLIKDKLKNSEHLAINSHITPLMNYKQMYEHRHQKIWFDDVYYLLLNKLNIALLKQICETTETKRLCYHTTSELIGDVPEEFTTSSKVLITCNCIEGSNPHLKAVKDRGFHIEFNPTRQEIISRLQEVSQNYPLLEDKEKEEVLNIIEANSKYIKDLSLRTLVKGFQLFQYYKQKGVDWQEDFLKMLGLSDKMVRMNELLVKYDNDNDRLTEWEWSRQTFYTYKRLAEV
jgi:hypothetical protein